MLDEDGFLGEDIQYLRVAYMNRNSDISKLTIFQKIRAARGSRKTHFGSFVSLSCNCVSPLLFSSIFIIFMSLVPCLFVHCCHPLFFLSPISSFRLVSSLSFFLARLPRHPLLLLCRPPVSFGALSVLRAFSSFLVATLTTGCFPPC